jgi:hypothetical protein
VLRNAIVSCIKKPPTDVPEPLPKLCQDHGLEVAPGALSRVRVAVLTVIQEPPDILREKPARPETVDSVDGPRPPVPVVFGPKLLSCR